jgi:hypothetical protein
LIGCPISRSFTNIADGLYSEVWANVATAGIVEIHVGPVESEDGTNNVVWDRAKQKSLFITDFQITLTQVALQIRVRRGATPPSLSVPREALPEYMKSSAVDFAGIDVGVYSVLPGHPVTVPLEFAQFLRWSVRVSAANITALA